MINKKWLSILLIYIFIVISIYIFDSNIKVEKINVQQVNQNSVIGEMTDKLIVTQSFISQENNISSIELMFGTYARKNSGEIFFSLKENLDSEKNLITKTIKLNNIKDNEMYKIDLGNIYVKKYEKLYMVIKAPDSALGDAITLWYDSRSQLSESKLYINNNSIMGQLKYNIYYKTNKGVSL